MSLLYRTIFFRQRSATSEEESLRKRKGNAEHVVGQKLIEVERAETGNVSNCFIII